MLLDRIGPIGAFGTAAKEELVFVVIANALGGRFTTAVAEVDRRLDHAQRVAEPLQSILQSWNVCRQSVAISILSKKLVDLVDYTSNGLATGLA